MIRYTRSGLLIAQMLLATAGVGAYEIETHALVSEIAGPRSQADDVLKDHLGVNEGLSKIAQGFSLAFWLGEGSRREDNVLRLLNHFHNPVAAVWSQAGLLGSIGQSSIVWAQNSAQGFPAWSWTNVRQRYFDALTKLQPSERDSELAKTFEGLGRQMHLIQDAASPAHVRNDPHLLYNYESLIDAIQIEDRSTFEGWLAASPDVPGAPDPGWTSLDPNPLAPIAIARLIDSDRYSGGNPAVTMAGLIGLAEYTNANFFSEDRIFTENDVDLQKRFPFPNRASVIEQDFDIQVRGVPVKRRYFVKTGDGAVGYRLATVGLLRDYHQRFGLDWTRFRESPALDEGVYRDYATRLVPRAVTYSTALIDYFFRGRIAASGDAASTTLGNISEEPLNGTFTLYYDDENDVRRPVPGATWALALAPGESAEQLRFTSPISPEPKEAGRYMLVFRGALGSEPDAVIGRQVTLSSSVVARLIKRKDGTPLRGFDVHAIDLQTGQTLSANLTDDEGRARLDWKPGRTALFLPTVNPFPMYWAGGSAFVSGLEGAHAVQAVDVDAQGQVTVVTPLVLAEWPERIEPCTGQPMFQQIPNAILPAQSTPVSEGVFRTIFLAYGVNLATFVRNDNGQETVLCGLTSPGCQDPGVGFIAEDVSRVGQVVGQLVRDVFSRHTAMLTDPDGRPIGDALCSNEYAEVETVPVSVGER
jgi:hypothetical protein